MRRHHWKLAALLVMKSVSLKTAQRLLPELLTLLDQLAASPARALADTLQSWLEPIGAMWRLFQIQRNHRRIPH